MSTIIRRRRNNIETMKEGTNWIGDEKGIGEYFAKNFVDLFSSSFPSIDDRFASLGTKYIADNENKKLSRIPFEVEIKEAVWQFHLLKSPGPYGYSRIFYRRYWKSVMDKVIGFVQECFELGQIPTSAN